MKGTIKIDAKDSHHVDIEMRIKDVSEFDICVIFDSLANAFELDEERMGIIGVMLLEGGLRKFMNEAPRVVTVPGELIELLKKEGHKNENAED